MTGNSSRRATELLRYTEARAITAMVILLMGVTAAGKTTVGETLTAQLHWRFADADSYHSAASVAKMRAGIPLTDADRAPWLASLHNAIFAWLQAGDNVVLACSALKAAYRAQLLLNAEVKLVYLRAPRELIAARLAERKNHYMNPSLLDSQFETLEEPADAITVDAALPADTVVAKIRQALGI